MSITRLQQARQMYAMGQRVGGIMGSNGGSMLVTPTRDGSRPGYSDTGPGGNPGDVGAGHTGDSIGGGNGGDGRPNMADIAGPKTTTTQTMQDYMEDYATNVGKKANPRGGFFSDNTPEGKKNNLINNINFAPKKNPFSLGNIAKNIFLGIVAPQLLAGTKLGPAINTFNQVNRVAGLFNKNIDVKDTISSLFSGNNKSTSTSKSKSTSKNNTTNNGGKGDGEGLASLENQAGGYDEYILLLQKLQSGNISDSERNRYNVLKNMLGI